MLTKLLKFLQISYEQNTLASQRAITNILNVLRTIMKTTHYVGKHLFFKSIGAFNTNLLKKEKVTYLS